MTEAPSSVSVPSHCGPGGPYQGMGPWPVFTGSYTVRQLQPWDLAPVSRYPFDQGVLLDLLGGRTSPGTVLEFPQALLAPKATSACWSLPRTTLTWWLWEPLHPL